MLCKVFQVLPILYIIVTLVKGLDLEPKYAKSSQSYREQVPPVYHFNAVHVFSSPTPEMHDSTPSWYHSGNHIEIQYAPLEETESNNHKHTHFPERTQKTTERITVTTNKFDLLAEKDHLEPKWVTEDIQEHNHNQKARSFFPGHNIAVLQSDGTHGHNDLYRTYHNHVDHPKIRNKQYSTFQKEIHGTPEEHPISDGLTVLYLPGSVDSKPLQTKKSYARKPVPFVLTKPMGTLARSVGTLQRPSNLNKLQINTYAIKTPTILQAFSALAPGIHLNLARVYGIAHTHDKAHVDFSHKIVKPTAKTKETIYHPIRSFSEKKTILYPVIRN